MGVRRQNQIKVSRRSILGQGMASSLAVMAGSKSLSAGTSQIEPLPEHPTHDAAKSETYWRAVADQYEVTDNVVNLENGYWGIMARPVLAEYQRLSAWVNSESTNFARFHWGETNDKLHDTVADFLGASRDEIVLTRGATEALQALIGGYNKLRPGDTVLYADLDYSEMKNAMRWLADRRGVNPVKINFPEPTPDQPLSEAGILAFYERALDAHPKTRLLLLTHLNNWTGLIIPVAKIAEMARARGVDVILDAAHSVGQVDFKINDMGCNYIGVNLHKWVGAPIGCGVIYIKNGYTSDIDTFMGRNPGSNRVGDRIDTGTLNFAAHMTIPAALQFHEQIGTKLKEARLRYLRDIWVQSARKLEGLKVLTPDEPSMVAGLTSFRLNGVTTTEGNNAVMRRLAEEFGILTTRRTGPAAGDCVRVTPSFYNSVEDVEKLAAALKKITA